MGREFVLVVFEEVVVHTFLLGKAGMGPSYGNSFRVAAACGRPIAGLIYNWLLM